VRETKARTAEDTGQRSGDDGTESRVEDLRQYLDRSEGNDLVEWVLLKGSRTAVTATLLLAVGVALVLASYTKPLDMHTMLTETNTVQALFSSLLSGAILLVSIVVSINSVVLSQEITDIENQEERISASIEYRKQVEEYIDGDVIPARPAEFLRVVLYTILRQTWQMEEWAAENNDEEFREMLDTYLEEIQREIHDARETLVESSYGTFRVLLVGLNYDYSGQLHAARRFRREYARSLTDEEDEALESLVDMLTFYATGQEYFKSLYYKKELAHLSSRLLFVSLPVIVFTSFVLLAIDAGLFPQVSVLRLTPLLLLVIVSYVVALAPYVVLTAYVLRLMTVTLRTLASGPFILDKGRELDSIDWGTSEASIDWERPDDLTDD